MKTSFLFAGVSALAIMAGQQAAAQNFYAGLGYEKGSGDLDSNNVDINATSMLAGYRYGLANNFFVGGELETSLINDYSFGSSSGVSMERLSRLRLLAGYDFGQFAVFGALGGTQTSGNFIGSGDIESMDGTNFGLGGEYAATDRISLRLEAIQDNLSGNLVGSDYDWDNTSVRAAATFKF